MNTLNGLGHYSECNEASRILDILDANATDAQFNQRKDASRLLHVCKNKGFPMLRQKGLIEIPEKREAATRGPTRKFTPQDRLRIATECRDRMLKGEGIQSVSIDLKMTTSEIRRMGKMSGIEIPKRKPPRGKMNDAQLDEFKALVNEKGMRLIDACKSLNVGYFMIMTAMKKKGLKYNKKTVRIEKS